jgi:hypothetical protein
VETFVSIVATITVTLLWKRPKLTAMQQALSRYYGNAATHRYTTGTATLPWKCNMVHRLCYQGKPDMSQYLRIHSVPQRERSRVSSGSIVSDYGLDDRVVGVRSPAGAKDFSCRLCVQTGSGAHPASCPMGTGGPFPGGKSAAGAWRWPLTPV